MPSHSEGPGIWLSVWRFLLTHCLYERAAKVLARLRGLAWTFAARIGDKYQIRLTRSICLIFIQPGACSARNWLVSEQQSQPIRKQSHRKGINFYKCFDLLLHASCNNMLSKQCNRESNKSVISVIKIRGIATFDINVHFCWGLM